MSKLCFKLGENGKLIYIPIYVEKFPKKPDPDPTWKRKFFENLNGHFEEIIKVDVIKKELVTDLAILSSIKRLATQLSPEFSKGLQEQIKGFNKQINSEYDFSVSI